MIRIAIDTNALYTTNAGSARYVRGLMRGLEQISPADLELTKFAWPVENLKYRQPARAMRTAYRELIWATVLSPILLKRRRIQLLHTTASLPLRHPRSTRRVSTLLDCSPVRFPDRFRRWQRITSSARLKHITRAERIICISRFTADEAMRFLGVSSAKIEVIYLGSDFAPNNANVVETPPPFSLPGEFFLFVGSLEPGKNLSLLRSAYEQARANGHSLPPLVIVGSRWHGVANEGKPPDNWIYADIQPDSVLLYCYRKAIALVFPSTYEGFGLPVLEAMSVGCPVVCSPVASLPEVAGDAACYAPHDAAAYLDALRKLQVDAKERQDIIERGKRQAARFSWRACAQQTLSVYRQTLDTP